MDNVKTEKKNKHLICSLMKSDTEEHEQNEAFEGAILDSNGGTLKSSADPRNEPLHDIFFGAKSLSPRPHLP